MKKFPKILGGGGTFYEFLGVSPLSVTFSIKEVTLVTKKCEESDCQFTKSLFFPDRKSGDCEFK